MSILNELTVWQEAVEAYDLSDHQVALDKFGECLSLGAKVHFSIGMVYVSLNQWGDAIAAFTRAIQRDQYLAIAYFERGVSYMALGDYDNAVDSFTDTIEYLRDHQYINYQQIGIDFILLSFEVFFNRALCFLMLGDEENALLDLCECDRDAKRGEKEKDELHQNPIHRKKQFKSGKVIQSWEKGRLDQDYMAFSVQLSAIYRPPKSKIDNMEPVDYLGKGKVLASIYKNDNITGFEEPHRQGRYLSLSDPGEGRCMSLAADLKRLSAYSNNKTFNRRLSAMPKMKAKKAAKKSKPTESDTSDDSGEPVLSKRSRRRELRAMRRPSDIALTNLVTVSEPSLLPEPLKLKRSASLIPDEVISSPRTPVTPMRPMYMSSTPTSQLSAPSLLRPFSYDNDSSPHLYHLPSISDVGPLFETEDLESLLSLGRTRSSFDSKPLKIKCFYNSDIRKLSLSKDVKFPDLKQEILNRYQLGDNPVNFKYEDEDSQLVTIASQDDLEEAVSFALKSQKLNIHVLSQ